MNGIYAIKPAFQKALKPIEIMLIESHVHPDLITFAALLVSLAGACAIACSSQAGMLWLLCTTPIFAFLRTVLNALDGMVAVSTCQARPWGEVLNEFCDRLSDIAIFGGIFLSRMANGPLLATVVITILLSSYMGILSKSAGAKRQFGGLMGKADRMIFLGLAGPLAFILNENGVLSASIVLNTFLVLLLLGSVITIFQRGVKTYVDLKSLNA